MLITVSAVACFFEYFLSVILILYTEQDLVSAENFGNSIHQAHYQQDSPEGTWLAQPLRKTITVSLPLL